MPVSTAVVGRQAIIDRGGDVIGYELLFRRLPTSVRAYSESGADFDGDAMTVSVLNGALGIGLGRLTGGRTAFFNADRNVLTDRIPISLPAADTVVEVLESVSIDDAVLAGCESLRRAGYRLAADDFTWFPGAERLLELVDFVKIDLQAQPRDQIPVLVDKCRPFGVRMLAEKVETAAELAWCRDAGFDLFQGYHLSRPQTVIGNVLSPVQRNVIRLSNEVLREDVDFAAVEQVLRVEPALTYQLLQLASLGRFGETRRTVRSIREGLVLMGLERLRSWIPALMMRPTGRAIDTHLLTVLARANTVELLAAELHPELAGPAFTAGMISGFDLLLGLPRDELLGVLDLPPSLRADAFSHETPIARLIADVVRYEQRVDGPIESAVTPAGLDDAAAHAFRWAVDAVDIVDRSTAA